MFVTDGGGGRRGVSGWGTVGRGWATYHVLGFLVGGMFA